MKDPKRMYDKNEARANLKKYLIILVCFLPILILLNFTIFVNLSSGLMIFLDIVLCLCFVFVVGAIYDSIIKKRKESKESIVNNNQKLNSKNNTQDIKNKNSVKAQSELNKQDENKN